MSDTNHNINRIMVSVDAGGFSLSIMESVVMLASHMQADLCGLFIEDTELLELANLPFTREITLHTALSRDLSSDSMKRNLNAISSQMRHAMEDLAKISDVTCSFRTASGPRLETVISESGEFQLVLIMPRKRLTEHKRDYVTISDNRPIILFYDGAPQSLRAINVLKAINGDDVLKLLLVLTTVEFGETNFVTQLPVGQYRVKLQHVQDYDVSDILNLVKARSAGLVILPLEDQLLKQGREVRRLLDTLSCPLILVR